MSILTLTLIVPGDVHPYLKHLPFFCAQLYRCRVETDVLEAFRPKMGSEYTTARMMYPQFLFGLLKVAEKRRSGFQEVRYHGVRRCATMGHNYRIKHLSLKQVIPLAPGYKWKLSSLPCLAVCLHWL